MKISLTQKYNVPGPRYTSYPTVPYWNEAAFTVEEWKSSFQRAFSDIVWAKDKIEWRKLFVGNGINRADRKYK